MNVEIGNVPMNVEIGDIPMNVEIRRADLADLDLLMRWRMTVLREVFDLPPGQPLEKLERENRAYYEAMLPADGHIACFARRGEEIVGCGGACIYREMPSPDNPSGQCAYLMNIYMRPEFRGHGIGEAVVRWLVGQAAQRGITKIYLETSASGRGLYEKTGFSEMPDMMKWEGGGTSFRNTAE